MKIIGIGKESGPFFIPAAIIPEQLNKVGFVNFIVDTGADESIISYADAVRIGIDFSILKERTMSYGIGGGISAHLLKNVMLLFETDDPKNPVYPIKLDRIEVLPEQSGLYLPSILGIDVLSKFSLHFDNKSKLMYLESIDREAKGVSSEIILAQLDKQDFEKRYSYKSYDNEFVQNLCLYIDNKLRAFFPRDRPQQEQEVEDEIEKLLIARNYEYVRQGISFAFASKVYRPDIVFKGESTVLEVKLCKSPKRERQIIDGIGSDIVAYKSRFDHMVFVVYDLGVIRNPLMFKSDIESNNSNTLVLIVQG